MQDLPHHYRVDAAAGGTGSVTLSSKGLQSLSSAPPAEFGGPGDQWSPETLLIAAVVDCLILTFRAIARASSLEWVDLHCEAEAKLDRVEGKTRFTGMKVRASLRIPPEVDASKATRLLEKAERGCLVTNSLAFPVELEPRVVAGGSSD